MINLQETSNMAINGRICAELQWPVHVYIRPIQLLCLNRPPALEILQKVNMDLATELHVSESALSDQKQKL